MNDIWGSEDGIIWQLFNPGCKYHEQGSPWAQGSPGTESSYCTSNFDCYGDSYCVLKGTTQVVDVNQSGECRCNIWSPRERHSVVVYKKQLFLSGGLTRLEFQRCGDYPCGGGYRHWADDMWVSYDGKKWKELLPLTTSNTLNPQVVPSNWTRFSPRGEHALQVIQDRLCVVGGRGRRHDKLYRVGEDEYLNDVWLSQDGENWTLAQDSAPFHPRSMFVSGVRKDARNQYLYIVGGQSLDGYSNEVWTLTTANADFAEEPEGSAGGESTSTIAPTNANNATSPSPVDAPQRLSWKRDYDPTQNESSIAHALAYVSPDSNISMMFNLEVWHLEILRQHGILTIRDLANMKSETTFQLRGAGNFHNVCDYKKRAEAVVNKCSVKPILYDGYHQDTRHVNLRG
jgi:hypothetical protein